MDGVSLLPRILDRPTTVPRMVFSHSLMEAGYKYEQLTARSERYKLIRTVSFAARPTRMKGTIGERFSRLATVADLADGTWRELYDLQQDPLEHTNVLSERPDIARELEGALDRWTAACGYEPMSSRLRE
jgi:hypothetical protein